MAELLTHVLVPFIVLSALRWQVDWMERRWIPVAMGGAAVPDLGKVGLVIDASTVQGIMGVPFEWTPVGTLAGVLVIAAAIAIWFNSERHTAYGWLVFGGLSALVLDGLRVYADGFANFWLYPLWWRPPAAGWYVSSDFRVTVLVVGIAAVVFVVDRWLIEPDSDDCGEQHRDQ